MKKDEYVLPGVGNFLRSVKMLSTFHFLMSKVFQLVLPSAEAEGSVFKSGFQATYATAVLQKPRTMMTLDKQYMCQS